MQRINAHLHAKKTPPYVVNLDPAVRQVPFPVNIGTDVRMFLVFMEGWAGPR